MHPLYTLRNGGAITVRGFESRSHRQTVSSPGRGCNLHQGTDSHSLSRTSRQLEYPAFGCESQGDSQ